MQSRHFFVLHITYLGPLNGTTTTHSLHQKTQHYKLLAVILLGHQLYVDSLCVDLDCQHLPLASSPLLLVRLAAVVLVVAAVRGGGVRGAVIRAIVIARISIPLVVSAGHEHDGPNAHQLENGPQKQAVLQNLIENVSLGEGGIYRHAM